MKTLDLVAALPKLGGFNRLEKEEYYRLFLQSSEDTVALLTIAAEIAAAKGWTQEEAISRLQNMESGKPEDVLALSDHLPRIMEFDQSKKRAKIMEGFALAELILISRLPVAWIRGQSEALAEYGIEIDCDALGEIPRRDWLSNEARREAIAQIVDLLPGQFIRPIEDFAIAELNEGRTDSAPAEGRDETPLVVPSASSQSAEPPTSESASSGINATSASKPAGFKTLVSTGKKSA
jgi:hypothetical protein